MRKIFVAVITFGGLALLGPLIRFAAWPPSMLEREAPSLARFVYDTVFLLWPTQPLGAIEESAGRISAAVVGIGANILLFGLIGLLVGAVAKTPSALAAFFAIVCAALILLALWGAGFSFAFVNWLALVIALLAYSIPFWVLVRALRDVA
jgi:hypothetical protein